jgi:ribokinase
MPEEAHLQLGTPRHVRRAGRVGRSTVHALHGMAATSQPLAAQAAIRAARAAGALVSTARGLETLRDAAVRLDALVASANDPGERYEPGELNPPPRYVVRTAGREGGSYDGEESGRWDATPLPGPVSDLYGCGDSFAAGLTYGLGAGWPVAEALQLGARCGAACATGRGPYEAQLRL